MIVASANDERKCFALHSGIRYLRNLFLLTTIFVYVIRVCSGGWRLWCLCARLSAAVCGYNVNSIVRLLVDAIDLDRNELPLGVHFSSPGEAIVVVRRGKTIKPNTNLFVESHPVVQFRFENGNPIQFYVQNYEYFVIDSGSIESMFNCTLVVSIGDQISQFFFSLVNQPSQTIP